MSAKTCFVIMPFNKKFDEVYQQHIKPLIENNLKSVKCIRIDKHPRIGSIIAHIKKEIEDSSFIIADITGFNPNVFYEIGFAHALGKGIIFIKNKSLGKLPFDISGDHVIVYDREKGYEGLQTNIKEIIKNSIKDIRLVNAKGRNTPDEICGIWFGEYIVRRRKHYIQLHIERKKIDGKIKYEAYSLITIDNIKIHEILQYNHVLNRCSCSSEEWEGGVWIEFIGSSWSNLSENHLVDYWLDVYAIKKILINGQLQVKIWDKVNTEKQEIFLYKSNNTKSNQKN